MYYSKLADFIGHFKIRMLMTSDLQKGGCRYILKFYSRIIEFLQALEKLFLAILCMTGGARQTEPQVHFDDKKQKNKR